MINSIYNTSYDNLTLIISCLLTLLQAISNPPYKSTCLVSVGKFDVNILKTKWFTGLCQQGAGEWSKSPHSVTRTVWNL